MHLYISNKTECCCYKSEYIGMHMLKKTKLQLHIKTFDIVVYYC